MNDILKNVQSLPQRQDSVQEQLADLERVANKLGMYDAADAIRQLFSTNRISTLRYGCHVDLGEHDEPDECVIDLGRPHECVYAKGIRKEQCVYWRIVTNENL